MALYSFLNPITMPLFFRLIIAISFLLGCFQFSACSEEDEQESEAIVFSTYVPQQIRAVGAIDRPECFKVNAYTKQSTKADFMKNQLVKWENGTYKYSPLKYWPNEVGSSIEFFAWWIGDHEMHEEHKVYRSHISTADGATDMIYATPLTVSLPQGIGEKIKFHMHHLLANVKINVRAKTDLSEDVQVEVIETKIKNVFSEADLTIREGQATWENKGTPHTLVLQSQRGAKLIPQTTKGIMLEVDYRIKQRNNLGEWVKYDNQSINTLLPTQQVDAWAMNKVYTYTWYIEPQKILFDVVKIEEWSAGTHDQGT